MKLVPTDGNIALFTEPKKKKKTPGFPWPEVFSLPGQVTPQLIYRTGYLAARAICVILEQGPRIHGTAVAGEISS